MNEIARTVVFSVVSGLIAFGGAVLYLGGDASEPFEPSLTRADVQSIIDSHSEVSRRPFDALEAARVYAICADANRARYTYDLRSGMNEGRAADIARRGLEECWGHALDQFYR